MFERSKPQQVFGSNIELSSLPLPEGQKLSKELIQSISDLPEEMRLPKIGIVTPWARQTSGGGWEEIESPKENIELFQITEPQVRQAFHKLFGQPLPFLGIFTKSLPTQTELEAALAGTDYEYHETFGVYSQKDDQHIPDIRFFHWISSKALGTRKFHSLSVAAKALQGALVFAERVPYLSTSRRGHPAISFSSAIHSRPVNLGAIGENVVEIPEVVITAQPSNPHMLVVAGVATALATLGLGILLHRRAR